MAGPQTILPGTILGRCPGHLAEANSSTRRRRSDQSNVAGRGWRTGRSNTISMSPAPSISSTSRMLAGVSLAGSASCDNGVLKVGSARSLVIRLSWPGRHREWRSRAACDDACNAANRTSFNIFGDSTFGSHNAYRVRRIRRAISGATKGSLNPSSRVCFPVAITRWKVRFDGPAGVGPGQLKMRSWRRGRAARISPPARFATPIRGPRGLAWNEAKRPETPNTILPPACWFPASWWLGGAALIRPGLHCHNRVVPTISRRSSIVANRSDRTPAISSGKP